MTSSSYPCSSANCAACTICSSWEIFSPAYSAPPYFSYISKISSVVFAACSLVMELVLLLMRNRSLLVIMVTSYFLFIVHLGALQDLAPVKILFIGTHGFLRIEDPLVGSLQRIGSKVRFIGKEIGQ